jgi:2-octaprenyl-3-methyl-6-methoxy-1,4-benzoquinol hydroxylase
VAIVGGGVVGAACALALADAGLSVALVEGREPAPWQAAQPDLRVFAFAADNVQLLNRLGVWPAIAQARAWPYRRMQVWDAAGGEDLLFDADRFGRRELGYIVENGLLQDRLWAALPAAGVQLHCPARVEALEQDEDGVRLRLDDGRRLEAALAVAADGAESTLRQLAGIEVERMTTTSVAWWPTWTAIFPTRPRPGSASCRAGRWRCCRWPSAAARSSGPCPRTRRRACWRWTRTASTAN